MEKIKIRHLDSLSKKVTVVLIQKQGNVFKIKYKEVDMRGSNLTLCNLYAKLEANNAEMDKRTP